jgi:hypothetical protein
MERKWKEGKVRKSINEFRLDSSIGFRNFPSSHFNVTSHGIENSQGKLLIQKYP